MFDQRVHISLVDLNQIPSDNEAHTTNNKINRETIQLMTYFNPYRVCVTMKELIDFNAIRIWIVFKKKSRRDSAYWFYDYSKYIWRMWKQPFARDDWNCCCWSKRNIKIPSENILIIWSFWLPLNVGIHFIFFFFISNGIDIWIKIHSMGILTIHNRLDKRWQATATLQYLVDTIQ